MLEVEVEDADPEGNHTIYLCGKVFYAWVIDYFQWLAYFDLFLCPGHRQHHLRLLQPRPRQGPGPRLRAGHRRRTRQPGRRRKKPDRIHFEKLKPDMFPRSKVSSVMRVQVKQLFLVGFNQQSVLHGLYVELWIYRWVHSGNQPGRDWHNGQNDEGHRARGASGQDATNSGERGDKRKTMIVSWRSGIGGSILNLSGCSQQ